MKASIERRRRWRKIGSHLLLVPFLVFALFPFYHMGMTSLKTDRELYDLRAQKDPFQLSSRHADPSYLSRRLQLKQRLDALRTCGNGSCQTLEE